MNQPGLFDAKNAALDTLQETRYGVIALGRLAFVKALLKRGEATADDCHAAFPNGFPEGINPVCLGAVYRPMSAAGVIKKNGLRFSARKENHAREITVWVLTNREKLIEMYPEAME